MTLETIYDGDEVFTRDDFNTKELMDFIDQFSVDQFEQLLVLLVNLLVFLPLY